MENEQDIRTMCENLVDKDGIHIDIGELAGAYESVSSLKGFFNRCTDYSKKEAAVLARYIDKMEGNDYGFAEAARVRKRLEMSDSTGRKYSTVTIVAWVIAIVAVLFILGILHDAMGPVNFALLILYIGVISGICYACLYQQLRARKKYGKNDFQFLSKFKFVAGLNLPQNVKCTVICLWSRIVMTANGQEFSLPEKKIVDVSFMTNTEIQKQYVSSVGGAVGGAVIGAAMFAPLAAVGAIIGGTATQRTVRNNTKYLIFTYRDGEEIKYIIFDATKDPWGAKKFSQRFKWLKKRGNIKIDL